MVLTIDKINKIKGFVYERPMCISEIAERLEVNWRTADRYIEEIAEKTGEIGVWTFRKGTQGALKIVYWVNKEMTHPSECKKILYEKIMRGISKTDFSPFDIYQYVEPTKRTAFCEQKTPMSTIFHGKEDVNKFLKKTKSEFISFSGDVSWISKSEEGISVMDTIRKLAQKGISVKIIARLDFRSINNIKKLLSINSAIGKDMIEVRHTHQPLRGAIIDKTSARLIEALPPDESGKEKLVFYEIYDDEWVEWLKDVFWDLYKRSVPAEKRLKDLQSVHKMSQ